MRAGCLKGSESQVVGPRTTLRWFQFRLRTLLGFTLLLAMGLSWYVIAVERPRKQRQMVERLNRAGLEAIVEDDLDESYEIRPMPKASKGAWMRGLLGQCPKVYGVSPVWSFRIGRHDRITDDSISHLKEFPEIRRIQLALTEVTDAGLVHLTGLTHLRILCLGGTKVTDAGLAHLKGLRQLTTLELSKVGVTDAGLVHLKEIGQLDTLYLDGTKVTDAGLPHLRELRQLNSGDSIHNYRFETFFGPGFCRLKTRPSFFSNRF